MGFFTMKLGDIVLFNNKQYKILFIYESGFLELLPLDGSGGRFKKVVLVNESDVENYSDLD